MKKIVDSIFVTIGLVILACGLYLIYNNVLAVELGLPSVTYTAVLGFVFITLAVGLVFNLPILMRKEVNDMYEPIPVISQNFKSMEELQNFLSGKGEDDDDKGSND